MLTVCYINRDPGRGYHYSDTNACSERAASKKNVNLREMKLAHRNYLGLNARRPVFGFTTMQDSNQPAQLQRVHVSRKPKFCV